MNRSNLVDHAAIACTARDHLVQIRRNVMLGFLTAVEVGDDGEINALVAQLAKLQDAIDLFNRIADHEGALARPTTTRSRPSRSLLQEDDEGGLEQQILHRHRRLRL